MSENISTVNKNKRKKSKYFETYISKVLKTLGDNAMTSNGRQQLNSFLCFFAKEISRICLELIVSSNKKTISEKEVSTSIQIIFPEYLQNIIYLYYENSIQNSLSVNGKNISRQEKAGIIFPPSICEKFLRNFGYYKVMIAKTASLYLACTLEKICFIILQNVVVNKKESKTRITIRDLELAIGNIQDIKSLFKKYNIQFIGGGVIPKIDKTLLNKKRKKQTNTTSKTYRFRPGTVCIREIKKIQKDNSLIFSKIPFERMTRSIINDKRPGIKVSKHFFTVIQYYIEQYLTTILNRANKIAIHSGKVKLMSSHIDFIL